MLKWPIEANVQLSHPRHGRRCEEASSPAQSFQFKRNEGMPSRSKQGNLSSAGCGNWKGDVSSSLITELPPLRWRSQDVNRAMEEADLQNVNVVLMLEDFYLLGEEGCAFLSFSLWVWN